MAETSKKEVGKYCSYTPADIAEITIDALIDIGYRFTVSSNIEDEDEDLEVCDYGNGT